MAPTPVPTPVPTPAPTPEPTAEPTEEPEPIVTVWDIKTLLDGMLPGTCVWSDAALSAGWYGPYVLGLDGTAGQIAEEMTFILTQIDGIAYDVYYVTEPTRGEFYLYYG